MFNLEYVFVFKFGGIVYIIIDVEDLYLWMVQYLEVYLLFERVSKEDEVVDECVEIMFMEIEELKKVFRNKGNKYIVLFCRWEDLLWQKSI